ncbi:tetratricopeptide repeat protein [Kutzneria buriramensis]|uniref:Tetratricopeptide repeat protein n=1 Tax=Kutzneria buriramensis TaxID=1045776 RepID=A0A3E0HLL6_9PSEU|nr:tetratricopeptide repeat protein [Kutzneria buriramensis]REH47321.1 tetratricopeptide repeat protein [Kutzneria buriramensis]
MAGNLSRACIGLGDYQQALKHGQHGLALRRQCGDRPGEALALHHLARAWQGLGDHPRAIDLCQKALAIGRTNPTLPLASVGEPLETLAECLHHTGHTSDAIPLWREAADTFHQYGEPHRAAQVRDLLRALADSREISVDPHDGDE